MKDIDFDELDKAVSSLMGTVPKDESTNAESSDNSDSASTAVSVAVDSDSAKQDEPDTPAASVIKPSRKPMRSGSVHSSQPSVATRRGRYMDMVRPTSSDNSPAVEQPKPRKDVTPESAPEPLAEEVKPPVPASTEGLSSVDSSASPSPKAMSDTGDMPDPLADFTSPPDEEVPSEDSDDTEASLSSPFLPNAKVEKRPLGRGDEPSETATLNAEEVSPAPLVESPITEDIEPKPEPDIKDDASENKASASDEFMTPLTDSSATNDRDAQLPEQPLPAELSSEILNIESSMSGMPEKPIVSTEEAKEVPTNKTPADIKKPPVVAASIPQQYKLKSKPDSDQPSGTIYDTSAYHQPIDHPDKKRPGWLIVAVIALIGLAGLVAGVVFYYFMYS